ncbi:ROK family transcriptional regulator [Treponema sp.]
MESGLGVKPKSVQDKNRRIVLATIRSMKAITMPELSERLGLSKTTMSKIITKLLEKGFIVSVGKGESSDEGGKRPELFSLNASRSYAIGVHIAPKQISVALSNLSSTIIDKITNEIQKNENLDVVVSIITQSVQNLLLKHKLSPQELIGIAIGAHGITDIEKGTSLFSPHFPSWGENVELKRLITESLSFETTVIVDNQIRFQVFAEHKSGIAQAYQNIVVIEGGEGLVAGIIVANVIQHGIHQLAGEIGHMPLDPYDSQECACGSKGCFEVLVSSQRVISRYIQTIKKKKQRSQVLTKDQVSLRDIFKAAENGDSIAASCLDETAAWFARGIANLILVVDPQIIIFQGIYAEAGSCFMEYIYRHLTNLAIPNVRKDLIVEYSKMGSDACLIGATGFLIEDYFKRTELLSD